jgi:hypothetical protein
MLMDSEMRIFRGCMSHQVQEGLEPGSVVIAGIEEGSVPLRGVKPEARMP